MPRFNHSISLLLVQLHCFDLEAVSRSAARERKAQFPTLNGHSAQLLYGKRKRTSGAEPCSPAVRMNPAVFC